jgi:hypothetical protein
MDTYIILPSLTLLLLLSREFFFYSNLGSLLNHHGFSDVTNQQSVYKNREGMHPNNRMIRVPFMTKLSQIMSHTITRTRRRDVNGMDIFRPTV